MPNFFAWRAARLKRRLENLTIIDDLQKYKETTASPDRINEAMIERVQLGGVNPYKENGVLKERTYKSGGLYGTAIDEIIKWLELAKGVAENDAQANALGLLINYYKTGDLKKWDEYNIAWVADVDSRLDVVNGFIEVYEDPLGKKATFESVVSVRDFEASKLI